MNSFWPHEIIRFLFRNLVSFILLAVLSFNLNAKIELLDRVIAVVDSGVIMETQLNSRVEEVLKRLQTNKAELPPLNLLEEQVLDRLIIEEIQMQIADRAGIKISDSELNETISRKKSCTFVGTKTIHRCYCLLFFNSCNYSSTVDEITSDISFPILPMSLSSKKK